MRRSLHVHTLLSVMLIAIVLCLIWFAERFTMAMDVTSNQRHSLSTTTVSLLQAMDTPLELIAVIGPDAQQREGVQALVSRFQAVKPDITLSFINPETQPAEARALNAAPGGELILQSGHREQRLQSLSERSLAGSLRQLQREGDRDIAFITGHDERSPVRPTNNDWQLIADNLARSGLLSREVSLVSNPYLDDDIDLVVLADPVRPYFPGEIASITDYVQRGGNLLWLSELASDHNTGPGLQTLSKNLGVDILPGTVIDTASQSLAAASPDFVLLDQFPDHPVTRQLTSPVLLPQAGAIAVTPLAGQQELALLQTPESSWTETGALQGAIAFDENTDEVSGPLMLGVTIERDLGDRKQRFAVIADADFAASQFVGNGANQSFTEALMLWLTGDADDLEFVTQRAPDSELTLQNRTIVLLTIACLLAIPALFVLTAIIVRWRRRA